MTKTNTPCGILTQMRPAGDEQMGHLSQALPLGSMFFAQSLLPTTKCHFVSEPVLPHDHRLYVISILEEVLEIVEHEKETPMTS